MKNSENQRFLRDFTIDDYNKFRDLLPKNVRKRAFHVITENNRVLKSKEILRKNDLHEFGKLMNESHESLNTYYEVSCPELNWLTKMARKINGVYGSRLTGAGFGGSTVTLIEKDSISTYINNLSQYEKKFGFKPKTFITSAESGVHLI